MEDYKKKYENLVKNFDCILNLNTVKESGVIPVDDVRHLIPELKESEDEMIRSEIISFFKNLLKYASAEHVKTQPKTWITWLEKQCKQEQLYIRFGEIPTNEKSKIYQGEIEVGAENGVSVYPAFKTDEGNIVLGLSLPITKSTLYTQQHLLEYDNRPCYLVKGDYVGKDTDGQPLINNISIIENIDGYRVKEEKQCEQKPTDEVKPKFREGDSIQFKGFGHNRYTIKEVCGLTHYINTMGNRMDMSYTDANFEVIKDSDKIKLSPTWSEEDENRFTNLIFLVKDSKENDATKEGFIKFINRLKSLKEIYTWKPSDEQMEALLKLEEMHVLEHEKTQENAHLYMVVKSIREQLLKLREE